MCLCICEVIRIICLYMFVKMSSDKSYLFVHGCVDGRADVAGEPVPLPGSQLFAGVASFVNKSVSQLWKAIVSDCACIGA